VPGLYRKRNHDTGPNVKEVSYSKQNFQKFKCGETFIVSTGCNKDVESPDARPPAKADFKTLPAGISTGGATGTTVAASNHTFLCTSNKDAITNQKLFIPQIEAFSSLYPKI